MKFTNRLMLTAILMLAISMVSFAQRGEGRGERPEPEEMAKRQTERLTEVLELTDEQAKKVAAVNLKHAKEGEAKRAEMRAEVEKDRETMKAEREKTREAHTADMKAILTDIQFAKYEGMMAGREGKGKRKGRKGKRGKKEEKGDDN